MLSLASPAASGFAPLRGPALLLTELSTVGFDARAYRAKMQKLSAPLRAAARTAELLDAIRSLHALAWSLDMPRALLPGDALVDTPTAALAICGPALLHMFTKETRFG